MDWPRKCSYSVQKTVGRGVFGEVLKGAAPDGRLVALKRLPKKGERFDWKLVSLEVDVGKRLENGKGIPRLEDVFESLENVYLVFEFVDGPDLFSVMEARNFVPLPEREARNIFKSILESILYCHSKRVAHRDIKLDNILIHPDGKARLIDFGLATIDEDRTTTSFVGSPEYCAPEIIQRVPYSGYKADVYSLGMVLYCIIFGRFPYIPDQRMQLINSGMDLPRFIWPDALPGFANMVSAPLKELLGRMLEVDPDVRISMQEVSNHRWVVGKVKPPTDTFHLIPEGINVF